MIGTAKREAHVQAHKFSLQLTLSRAPGLLGVSHTDFLLWLGLAGTPRPSAMAPKSGKPKEIMI